MLSFWWSEYAARADCEAQRTRVLPSGTAGCTVHPTRPADAVIDIAPRSQHATPLSPTTSPPAGTAGRFPAPARGSPARYGAGVPASAASRAPTPRQHAERPRPAPVAAEPRRDFRVGRIRLDRPGREGEGLLGYSDSSVLTRAFRRWSGKSPNEWRSEHAIAAIRSNSANPGSMSVACMNRPRACSVSSGVPFNRCQRPRW